MASKMKKALSNNPPPKPYLEKLPVEIKQEIMLNLPDVAFLKSLSTARLSFHNIFKYDKSGITRQVLLNALRYEVLPAAIAAFESSRRTDYNDEIGRAFGEKYLDSDNYGPIEWKPSEALHISDFHQHVQFFTEDFAAKTLANLPASATIIANQTPLTEREVNRFMRAFYWFETYRNIPSGGQNRRGEGFFTHFALWELEQLGCVHDYLFHVVALNL